MNQLASQISDAEMVKAIAVGREQGLAIVRNIAHIELELFVLAIVAIYVVYTLLKR